MSTRIIDIILPKQGDKEACIVQNIDLVAGVKITDLAELLRHHYQSEKNINFWRNEFLKYWMCKITHCAVAICHDKVGGIMLYIDKGNGNIYIRILCSKDHCGGLLLNYLINKYQGHVISVNSEPLVVGFYQKYGFVTNLDVPLESGLYPYMTRGKVDDADIVTRNYLLDIFRFLLSFALKL